MNDLIYFRLIDWDITGNDMIDILISELVSSLNSELSRCEIDKEDIPKFYYDFNINWDFADIAPIFYITAKKEYVQKIGLYGALLESGSRGTILVSENIDDFLSGDKECFPKYSEDTLRVFNYIGENQNDRV